MQIDLKKAIDSLATLHKEIAVLQKLQEQRETLMLDLGELTQQLGDKETELHENTRRAIKEMLPPGSMITGPRQSHVKSSTGPKETTKATAQETPLGYRLAYIFVAGNNEPMKMDEIVAAIHERTKNPENGTYLPPWKTSSPNPRSIIYQMLRQDPEFKLKGSGRGGKWALTVGAYKRYV